MLDNFVNVDDHDIFLLCNLGVLIAIDTSNVLPDI